MGLWILWIHVLSPATEWQCDLGQITTFPSSLIFLIHNRKVTTLMLIPHRPWDDKIG